MATPALRHGERLDRVTFHARYLKTPEDFRAELIGGVVHLPGRVTARRGQMSAWLLFWLGEYAMATPGVDALGRVTILLGPDSEPEPHACLCLPPECGGKTHDEEDFLTGPPELVIEVADDTEELVLGPKKADYERAGVKEYLVVTLRQQRVFWYYHDGLLVELPPCSDGVLRSRTFPGLWLDPAALLAGDRRRVRTVTAAGLVSPEHATFVNRMQTAQSGGAS